MRTYSDVLQCNIRRIDKRFFSTLDESCQQHIHNWTDVQRCLNGPRHKNLTEAVLALPVETDTINRGLGGGNRQTNNNNNNDNNKKPLVEIRLIGERHSGTKFIISTLQQCFDSNNKGNLAPHKSFEVSVRRDFLRPKHWFQPIGPKLDQTNRIVIAAFRDPYEWVAAMIQNPYHSPNHYVALNESNGDDWHPIPLPWQEFVHRPWTMNRTKYDWNIAPTKRYAQKCLLGFKYHELVPCIWQNLTMPVNVRWGYIPIYEQRRRRDNQIIYINRHERVTEEALPFENILQMRADKILNHLLEVSLTNRLGGFLGMSDACCLHCMFDVEPSVTAVCCCLHCFLTSQTICLLPQ
jgi:hypothetical protein